MPAPPDVQLAQQQQVQASQPTDVGIQREAATRRAAASQTGIDPGIARAAGVSPTELPPPPPQAGTIGTPTSRPTLLGTIGADIMSIGNTLGSDIAGARHLLGTDKPAFDVSTGQINKARLAQLLPVGGADVIIEGAAAAGGKLASSIGARFGLGAAQGAAMNIDTANPERTLLGAGIGGVLGATTPVFAKSITGRIEASAASGRFAQISAEAPSSTTGGPTLAQRIAMHFTGSKTPPPPVAGGGVEKVMEIGPKGEPFGISPGEKPTGKGLETTGPEHTQPPREIDLHLLQEIEGMQTKRGTGVAQLESEKPAPPPEKSMPAPAERSPYAGSPEIAFKEGGAGRNVGTSVKTRPFESIEEKKTSLEKSRPAGLGGPRNVSVASREVQRERETPAYDVRQRSRLYERSSASSREPRPPIVIALPMPSSSAARTTEKTNRSALVKIGLTGGDSVVTRLPSPSTEPKNTPAITEKPSQIPSQESQPSGGVTNVQVSPVQTTSTPPTIGVPAPPPPTKNLIQMLESPPRGGYGTFFSQGPSLGQEKRGRRALFGFRTIKHPVGNLFSLDGKGLGLELGGKRHGKKRKK